MVYGSQIENSIDAFSPQVLTDRLSAYLLFAFFNYLNKFLPTNCDIYKVILYAITKKKIHGSLLVHILMILVFHTAFLIILKTYYPTR